MPLLTPSSLMKIFDRARMLDQVSIWHAHGKEIVFTNGCFDILHAGHIQYLEAASALGNYMIVAVNDDASVRKLKGETRPINILASRMYVLASLSCVDAVVPFTEDTPLELIQLLRPDVLVKGGDYKPESIVGAQEVLSWGGRVEVIPYVEGFSTTRLENKILDMYRKNKDRS